VRATVVALLCSLFAVPAVNSAAAGLTTPPSAVQHVGSASVASVASGAHAYDQEYPSIPTSSAVPRVAAQQSTLSKGSSGSIARFGVAAEEAGGAISMDEAIERGAAHVGPNGVMETTGTGLNYQFRSMSTDAAGREVARIGRFDVNPADAHVSRLGPHLNLETQVDGDIVSNTHTPIDPATIRPGDMP
jgi:hypothetical protein